MNGWIDFDLSGDWDASEQILTDVAVSAGVTSLLFPVPHGLAFSQTWARIRFNETGGLGTTGYASEGEVEDYEVTIGHSDPDWFAERLLPKENPTNAAFSVTGINIAVTRSGKVYVFYLENSGVQEFFYVCSTDHGDTWSAPTNLAGEISLPMGSSGPKISIDQGDVIHATWQTQIPPHELYYARFDTSTETWSFDQHVYTSSNSIGYFEVTADRLDRVHLFWHDGDTADTNTPAEVMYALIPAGATNFNGAVMLSENDGKHSAFPVVDLSGVTGDTIAAAWRDNVDISTDDWDIKMNVSHDGGATWGTTAFTVGETDGKQWDPILVIDRNGVFHMAYHQPPVAITSNAPSRLAEAVTSRESQAPEPSNSICNMPPIYWL